MTVRAKFKLTGYRSSTTSQQIDPKGTWTKENLKDVELRTLEFSPVYGNGDPNHENTKFWNATPSGKVELGTVNPAAWQKFEIGKEYYLDFSPAE